MTKPTEELEALYRKRKEIDACIAAIYLASVDAPNAEKVCDDEIAKQLAEPELVKSIEYPITVHGITYSDAKPIDTSRRLVGSFVAIRPCDKEFGDKTFLGIYVGDVALNVAVVFHPNTGVLEARHSMLNPAIWVPDLKRIIFGVESWWGAIKSPDDLRKITDADISNVWYVQAIKAIDAPTKQGEA